MCGKVCRHCKHSAELCLQVHVRLCGAVMNVLLSHLGFFLSCLWQQVQDDAWELPYSGNDMVATRNIASTAQCADLCTGSCMFVTYDYQTRTCFIKNHAAAVLTGCVDGAAAVPAC